MFSDNSSSFHKTLIKFLGRFTSVISAALLLLILLTIRFVFGFTISDLDPGFKGQKFKHELCLIYDKPKRTGSTTISRALHKCWSGHYSFEPQKGPKNAHVAAARMIDLNQSIVAHSLRHILFSDEDCLSIDANCRRIFHITSTRRMNARLVSYAKVTSLQNKEGRNFTVESDDLRRVLRTVVRRGHALEQRYEKGVYKGIHRIAVNYVIRNSFLTHDLNKLLHAFGCTPQIKSVNTHIYNSSNQMHAKSATFWNTSLNAHRHSKDIPTLDQIDQMDEKRLLYWLENFPLKVGDRLHEEFLQKAELVNQKGLETLVGFRPLFLKSQNERGSEN